MFRNPLRSKNSCLECKSYNFFFFDKVKAITISLLVNLKKKKTYINGVAPNTLFVQDFKSSSCCVVSFLFPVLVLMENEFK